MPEVWQPIEGYEGFYEVSDQGKIRRLPHAKNFNKRTLKPGICSGYQSVVHCVNKVRKTCLVHRLVAKAFVPGDQSLTVNHKDGKKLNNHADNLEWVTPSEQTLHAIEMGLRPRAWGHGIKKPQST